MQVKNSAVAVTLLLVLAGPAIPASAAYSYCMEPRAPSFYGTKPSKPFCAAARNCSKWDVDNYRSSIEQHFNRLRQYAADVDSYYRNAQEYVECMGDLD